MVRYLFDPANAITIAGLVFSAIAMDLVVSDRPELGVAAVLWALLADHLDGVVAARTRNREVDAGRIGKNLDSFADLVSGAVFPALVLLQVNRGSLFSLITAMVVLAAGALRLSYFNCFGLSPDGRFYGVPLSYDVPLLAVLFLIRPIVSSSIFPGLICVCLFVLACLHVSSVRVPKTSGVMYAVVTLFAVTSSLVLAARGLS